MNSFDIPVYMHLLYRSVRDQMANPDKPIVFKDLIKKTVNEEFAAQVAKFNHKDMRTLYAYINEKVEEYVHTTNTPNINYFKNFLMMEIRHKIHFLDMIVRKREESEQKKFPARRKSVSKSSFDTKGVMKIKATNCIFYSMRFFGMDDGTVKYAKAPDSQKERMNTYQNEMINSKLNFATVVSWPNVRITFKTNIIEFNRSVNYNFSHYLTADPTKVDVKRNECNELFFNSPESVSASTLFHVPLLDAYFRLILESLTMESCDIPVWSRDQIQFFIETIRRDFEKLGEAYCQNTYTYHTNQYGYYRVFKNTDKPPAELAGATKVLHMVETINPEVEFCFQQCSFSKPMTSLDETQLGNYFQAILQGKFEVKELYETLRKSLTYQCTICWAVFNGAMALQTFIKHTVKHVSDKKWRCCNCQLEFDHFELAGENKCGHECRK